MSPHLSRLEVAIKAAASPDDVMRTSKRLLNQEVLRRMTTRKLVNEI